MLHIVEHLKGKKKIKILLLKKNSKISFLKSSKQLHDAETERPIVKFQNITSLTIIVIAIDK